MSQEIPYDQATDREKLKFILHLLRLAVLDRAANQDQGKLENLTNDKLWDLWVFNPRFVPLALSIFTAEGDTDMEVFIKEFWKEYLESGGGGTYANMIFPGEN